MKSNRNANENEKIALQLPIVLEGFKSEPEAKQYASQWSNEVWDAKTEPYVEPRKILGRTVGGGRGQNPLIRAGKTLWRIVLNLRPRA